MQDGEHERAICDEHAGNSGQHAIEVVDVGQSVVARNHVVAAGRQPTRSTGVIDEVTDSLRASVLVKSGTLDQFPRDVHAHDDSTSASEFSRDSAVPTSKIEDPASANIADEVEKSNGRGIVDGVAEQINVEISEGVVSG
jgi:hypothetical protein